MIKLLQELRELDLTFATIFDDLDNNDEDLALLVDNRERLLQIISNEMEKEPHWKTSPEWIEAVDRTKSLVLTMQKQTQELAQQVKRNQHGRQSVQQYKRFL